MRSSASGSIEKNEALITTAKSIASIRKCESSIDFCLLAEVVSKMIYAYGDLKGLVNIWNCMPLLFRSKLDCLIDSKYLAALLILGRHSQKQPDQFAYYACVLFQTKVKPASQLLELSSFISFKKSWQVLRLSHCHSLFPDILTCELEETLFEDNNQLKIYFQ